MKRYGLLLAVALSSGATAFAAPFALPPSPSQLREVAGEKPADVSAAKKDEIRIAALKERALGTDAAASLAAIRELKGMGNVARPTVVGVLRTVLQRDQDAINASLTAIGDGKEAAEFETKIDALRADARANIPKLSKSQPETIKKAHAFYDQLGPMTAKMNQAWSLRLTIVESMARRAELVRMWREVAPAGEKSFTVDAESTLKQAAVAAVGDILDRASGMSWGKPPTDTALKPLWFFGVCRRIEAWNAAQMPKFMDAEEIKNFNAVNTYREAIGLMPYEADPRLVQAARRHSKEMVDLKYFSHESPTPENKDFGKRVKNAGYSGATGENIAYGGRGGEGAFRMWFDSPGHHQNMAGGSNALGVGRWGDHFTQNFGSGPRVMLMGEAEQARVKVEGDVLAPDSGRTTTATRSTAAPKKSS